MDTAGWAPDDDSSADVLSRFDLASRLFPLYDPESHCFNCCDILVSINFERLRHLPSRFLGDDQCTHGARTHFLQRGVTAEYVLASAFAHHSRPSKLMVDPY